MQKRLELIVKEISSEPKLAQTDLDALANQLMQLEASFLMCREPTIVPAGRTRT